MILAKQIQPQEQVVLGRVLSGKNSIERYNQAEVYTLLGRMA